MQKGKDYGVSELEEEPEYEDSSDVPFNVMMQRAAAMRSKQGEIFRRRYDSWPPWYQHSMFAKDDIIKGRMLDFPGNLLLL